MSLDRYQRQLALPEITPAHQTLLNNARVSIIGAGGLGTVILPYLAAAGVGHITIIDHDHIDCSNLHRQILYKDAQCGQSKAEVAAAYAQALNPDITIELVKEYIQHSNIPKFQNSTLLIDGSDNFETKTLLNKISIEMKIPLLTASVNQWHGQIMLLAGFAAEKPCYHCLFPKLPSDARNCNEAGILGTSAGLVGMWQAHIALCYLLGLDNIDVGILLSLDFKNFRMQRLNVPKDEHCPHCKDHQSPWQPRKLKKSENDMTEIITMQDLKKRDHVIIDVRTSEEIKVDPVADALHIELSTLPQRLDELPQDTLLAFLCAGNVRSVKAAQYLQGLGYDNIIVLDKFSF